MDLIRNLPPYHGHSVIMVVIDRFSNPAHFGTLPNNFSACQAVELFTTMICKLASKDIISDGDPILFDKFRKTLFQIHETKLRMSTAYHLQTDNQREVLNVFSSIYALCTTN